MRRGLAFLIFVFALGGFAFSASAATTRFQVLQHANFGPYLADGQGRALYVFSRDMKNVSTCMKRCKAFWPLLPGGSAEVAAPLQLGDFSLFTHVRGPSHMTYRGAPLYYYAHDKRAGDIKGQGRDGGLWSLVNPEAFAGFR